MFCEVSLLMQQAMRSEFLSQYYINKRNVNVERWNIQYHRRYNISIIFQKKRRGKSHLKLSFSRKLFIPYVLYFFSLSGVLKRFWYPQLSGFVRIRLTITTKWKSSASCRKSTQKTSVRLSHLSRDVVFQIPLSIITQALRISVFNVINEFSMDESFIDYSTFASKMYRGLNFQFQIYVRFLVAIDKKLIICDTRSRYSISGAVFRTT